MKELEELKKYFNSITLHEPYRPAELWRLVLAALEAIVKNQTEALASQPPPGPIKDGDKYEADSRFTWRWRFVGSDGRRKPEACGWQWILEGPMLSAQDNIKALKEAFSVKLPKSLVKAKLKKRKSK
jgi:hypothetical protein